MVRAFRSRLYVIPVLSKALDVLELMQKENTPRTLEEIYQRTNISKTTVYRILKTLVHRGYLAHSENGLYRLVARPRKVRFGFGGESSEMPFSEGVRESLQAAANSAGVDLLVLDNHYDAQTAVRNAEEFVQQQVDLVIEFQIDQRIAPAKYLAHFAKSHWGGEVSQVLGLGIEEAGPLVQSRITGAFAGVRSRLPGLKQEVYVLMDGEGLREKSCRLVQDFLRRHSKKRGLLIAAATDTSGLGALQAVRELKREKDVAIVGQDCINEALEEMKTPGTPYIASVSHEAGNYGPRLIQLGLGILNGQTVPPYNYIAHKLVTAASLAKRARAAS